MIGAFIDAVTRLAVAHADRSGIAAPRSTALPYQTAPSATLLSGEDALGAAGRRDFPGCRLSWRFAPSKPS